MLTSFHPSTNRYAAIAAQVAAGPSEAERAATREAKARRRRHMFTFVEQDRPASSIPTLPRSREEDEARRAAFVAAYAREYQAVMNQTLHVILVKQLAAQHHISQRAAKRYTEAYRRGEKLTVPRADPCEWRPIELAVLRLLLAAPGHYLTGDAIAASLDVPRRRLGHDLIYNTRMRLRYVTGEEAAGGVILTISNPPGYRLDMDALHRYPAIVAALEDATP